MSEPNELDRYQQSLQEDLGRAKRNAFLLILLAIASLALLGAALSAMSLVEGNWIGMFLIVGASFLLMAMFALFAASAMALLFREVGRLKDRLQNAERCRPNLEKLEQLISADRPFTLFLRNFAYEILDTAYGEYTTSELPGGRQPLVTEMRWYPLILYDELLRPIAERMPVFGLFNEHDVIGATVVHCVYVQDWKGELERFVQHASLVVLLIEEPTAAIEWELDLLRRRDDVILICTRSAMGKLKDRPECSAAWVIDDEPMSNIGLPSIGARVSLPCGLAEHLAQRATNAAR